jgi:hypothetical protein
MWKQLRSTLDRLRGHEHDAERCRDLYLQLLKRSLLGLVSGDESNLHPETIGQPSQQAPHDARRRTLGADWPSQAPSMIGAARMDNIRFCIESVLRDGVAGGLIETGVWRGGAVIFMRGVLKAYGVRDRPVWVADSFEGLPPPDPARYPHDEGMNLDGYKELAVSLEQVRTNFERYELLDDQVKFLKGWFRDSLPRAPIDRLAVMRLDGDLYESTMDALTHLYPKLSAGGYVIIDDYQIEACRAAVHDFRRSQRIADPLVKIDWAGVYWRRERPGHAPASTGGDG